MSVNDHYRAGITVLGAIAQRKQAKKVAKQGHVVHRAAIHPRKGKFQGRRAYEGALASLKQLSSAAKKTAAKAASYRPSAHKTLLPAAKIGGKLVVGPNHHLTAEQQRAVNKHTQALIAHHNAVLAAQKAAHRAALAGKALTAEVARQWNLLKKYEPKTAKHAVKHGHQTLVRGDDDLNEALDLALEATLLGDDPSNPPDPSNPGYLMDGSPDPNYVSDGSSGATSDGGTTVPEAPDAPLIPYGQTLSHDDAGAPWTDVPDDGIVYDNSRGDPALGAVGDGWGSWRRFYVNAGDNGFGVPGDRGVQGTWGWEIVWGGQRGPSNYTLSDTQQHSKNVGAGPLVGNPSIPDLANLQFAETPGVFFWQAGYSPSWAVAQQNAAITRLNNKKHEAYVAAQQADAARIAQEQAQQAEAQAAQDAQNALAQSAADTQSQIAQQQQQDQQAALDIQSQQQAQQQAGWQAQQQAQAAQLQFQQQQMMQKAAQADLDWMIAHPEEAMPEAEPEAEAAPEPEPEADVAPEPEPEAMPETTDEANDLMDSLEGDTTGYETPLARLRKKGW